MKYIDKSTILEKGKENVSSVIDLYTEGKKRIVSSIKEMKGMKLNSSNSTILMDSTSNGYKKDTGMTITLHYPNKSIRKKINIYTRTNDEYVSSVINWEVRYEKVRRNVNFSLERFYLFSWEEFRSKMHEMFVSSIKLLPWCDLTENVLKRFVLEKEVMNTVLFSNSYLLKKKGGESRWMSENKLGNTEFKTIETF